MQQQPPGYNRQQAGPMMEELNPGDWVVYRKQKHSTSPGPRAKSVAAAPRGETYSYVVDKFWVVQELLEEGRVLLTTRKGKQHTCALDDPRLRRARWWERWWYRRRFEETAERVG